LSRISPQLKYRQLLLRPTSPSFPVAVSHPMRATQRPISRTPAQLETPYPIGSQFDETTETATEQPTEAPTQFPTDEEGWGHDIFKP